MLQPKSTLLQIRIEPELLARFKAVSEANGAPVSVLLRNVMLQVCDGHESRLRAKQAYRDKQKR